MSDPLPRRLDLPPLAWSTLDRAGHRRVDPLWLEQAWRRGRVLVVEDGRALVDGDRLVLVGPDEAPEGERIFLGVDPAGTPHFAVAAPLADGPGRAAGAREVGHLLDSFEAGLLLSAVGMANWHARHRFSPATGEPTTSQKAGWELVTADGTQLWPRTDPAVIVLIHDGVPGEEGRCLLGSNAAWSRGRGGGIPRFSCLAGFVEPGESAEQTLAREVAEEVGIRLLDLHYVASQPWPYPGSLMLGFHALADPTEPLRLDPEEISDARWFTRAEIRAVIDGDPGAAFGVSMPSSIAHHLIRRWLDPPPADR